MYVRMVLVIIVALALSFNAVVAQTHGNIQAVTVAKDQGKVHRLAAYVSAPIHGQVGMFFWTQCDKNWSQIYFGPTYSPVKWMQIGVGLGTETASESGRFGSFLWLSVQRTSLLIVDEEGLSGRFTKIEPKVSLTKQIAFGYWWDNMNGGGPKLTINIPHLPVTVWATVQPKTQQYVVQYNF